MTTKLSEREREVWKDLYTLHERYHDMQGKPEEWVRFASDVQAVIKRYNGSDLRLANALSLALYDWFGNEQKLRETAERDAPEQITMGV